MAYRWHNPQITATIRLLREELSAKMQIDNKAVLDEFSYVAFSDVRSFLDKTGRLLPVTAWSEGTSRAVQSFKIRQVVDGGESAEIIELKFWPKLPALESLSRHLGLFERDNKQRSTALSEILEEIDTGAAFLRRRGQTVNHARVRIMDFTPDIAESIFLWKDTGNLRILWS